MIIHRLPNGEFCVGRKPVGERPARNWFLVKQKQDSYCGYLLVNSIIFPKDFIGKKIRLKVELIDKK
jgi:hypothetical protein